MVIYGKEEITMILRCSDTYAYRTIRNLTIELEEKGFCTPCQGKIQAKFFCDRFGLDMEVCERLLKQIGKKGERHVKSKK